MSTQVQIRRGTTAQHSSFTGASAELTYDTDLKTIRAHDGSTVGGTSLAKSSDLTTANVIESTNLYFTNSRSRLAITATGSINYDSSTGVISFTQGNSDTIVEGSTNLYYSNARSRAAISEGTGVNYNPSTGVISIGQNVDDHSSVTFANVIVTGNLLVQGNAILFESNTLVITDPLIQVGKNPVGDTVDLGFFGHYIDGSSVERHAGLFRDASDGQFKLFGNLFPEPSTIVATADASYNSANLVLNYVVGRVTDISNHTTVNLTENTNLYFTNARAIAAVTKTTLSNLTVSGNFTTGTINVGTSITVDGGVYGNVITTQYGSVYATGNNANPFSIMQVRSNDGTSGMGMKAYAGLNSTLYSSSGFTFTTGATVRDRETPSGGTTRATLDSTGLSVDGNVTSPFFYSQSDINLKKDVEPISGALDIVKQLGGYNFKWKHNDSASIGLIAQYIEQVLPMLIGTAPDGTKTVLYNGIIAILLEAVKEQQVQINEIKSKLDNI